ncbi:MAG: cell filamentation protein Fic [Legionellales bacterium]|nr:cell filamentation protein Fic [Legionellales bacterium]
MATPSEKLAESLELLHEAQQNGQLTIRAGMLPRTHQERLVRQGFLREIIKGWYVPSAPDELPGDSTPWYASYWHFSADYLNERFGNEWCLSPEQSLLLHAGNWTIPQQLLVRAPRGSNKKTDLPHNTSLFDVRYAFPEQQATEKIENLSVYKLEPALVACSEKFFTQHPTDARAVIAMIIEPSKLLSLLLEGGHSVIAGRLAGAFRNIGKDTIADTIIQTMKAAEYNARETDPFDAPLPLTFQNRAPSPYVNRLRVAWQTMREAIIGHFPKPANPPTDIKKHLEKIEANYVTDAYHSLSIEGYRVSRELIERVRSGSWRPENNITDRNHKDALAARGYWQAFQAVKQSIRHTLEGNDVAKTIAQDHVAWYRELFGPCVTAGLLKPADLAGYRHNPVYIRQSMHVPANWETVPELLQAFFELLGEEPDPGVRVVLGHFFFVNIHPYMDGNGRMGRFLMNVLLTTSGFPWTVIPVEQRDIYMGSLEQASVGQDIQPFCGFIADLVKKAK